MAGMMRRREGQGQTEQGQSREMSAPQGQRGMGRWPMGHMRSLVGMDPFRQMREMLNWDPFAELGSMMGPAAQVFSPDIEVRETKDAYMICADLPGLKEEDVSIDVSGNRLTISGKREEEQRDEGDRYWAVERSYGSFTRSFTLPEGVSPDQIDASLESGVLKVRIPKAKAEEPKRIQIKGGARAEGQPMSGAQATQGTGAGAQTSAGAHGASQASTGAASTTGPTQGGSREKAA